MKNVNKISVVMSVWLGDKTEFVVEAIESILSQTLPPREFIIVVDGKISKSLFSYLEEIKNNVLKVVYLKDCVGRGKAKNIGVNIACSKLIAIMDSDDIALPNRFIEQIKYIPRYDCVFSWQNEFYGTTNNIVSIKKSPELHSKIERSLKFRCLLSNPTMMIKKEAFLAVNGYCEEFKYVNEDGCLFTKLIQAGYKFYSIQKPLISVRVDINQRKRRTGLKIFMEDIKYKKFQFDKNFISKFDFLVQLIVYFVFRLTPSILKNYVYRLLRR